MFKNFHISGNVLVPVWAFGTILVTETPNIYATFGKK